MQEREKNTSVDVVEPEDQAIGRSRGGLTKIHATHATCDALGNPTGFFLTGGQAHDLEGLMSGLMIFQALLFWLIKPMMRMSVCAPDWQSKDVNQ